MKKKFGKRGSYTVFLTMFMSGMLIMAGAVINAAHMMAIDSSAEDLGRVWANSIIGEYDIVLKERYGLMGYYGNQKMVEDKLIRYSDYTYKSKKYIKVGAINCHLKEYKLSDPEIFREQIRKTILTFHRPKAIEDDVPVENQEEEGGGTREERPRRITSGWLKEGLPSRTNNLKSGGVDPLSSFYETAYIFKFFKDHVDKRDLGKTYFENEIEYIISGKLDDEKARKSVYRKLLVERNGLNLAYLYSCSTKRNAALEAAELLTPGPEAAITQAIILEAWALLEAMNDMELLYDGEKVPLIKGDDNWALSLENAVDYVSDKTSGELDTAEDKKYVRPKSIEGQKYEDYLKTLLLAVPEKHKILRMMDLIQINMKYTYCGFFLMDDYYTGLEYEMEVNGKEHVFKAMYG